MQQIGPKMTQLMRGLGDFRMKRKQEEVRDRLKNGTTGIEVQDISYETE